MFPLPVFLGQPNPAQAHSKRPSWCHCLGPAGPGALLRLVRPAGGFRIEGSHLGPGQAERQARSSALERTNSAGESQVAGGS